MDIGCGHAGPTFRAESQTPDRRASWMPSYILRNINQDMWESVKERAKSEGLTLREIALALLSAYASQKVSVSGASMTKRSTR